MAVWPQSLSVRNHSVKNEVGRVTPNLLQYNVIRGLWLPSQNREVGTKEPSWRKTRLSESSILGSSLLTGSFNAIRVGGAGAAYLSGGFDIRDFAFAGSNRLSVQRP